MTWKAYFVTGVCGVGKSTIVPYLRELLPPDHYDVRDFDERGVPDGADNAWRSAEVAKWLAVASENSRKDISTIVCGFAKETDLPQEKSNLEAEFILLDALPETIRERLVARYSQNGVFDETQKVIGKPVSEFIESNVYYCGIMRKEFSGEKIVDTTGLVPEEVAKKVAEYIQG